MDRLEQYWSEGFPYVDGFVDAEVLDKVRLVDATQKAAGISGHVAEIGVYHGKFLLAWASVTPSGGKVTALDVFEDQSKNIDGAGAGNLEILKRNVVKYG